MHKKISKRFMWAEWFIIISLAGILFAGCIHLQGNGGSATLKVTSEQLHHLEPLELNATLEEEVGESYEEPAPAELQISLEQCRAWALENNLDLKAQLIEPAIASERISEEEARFEVVFSGSMNWSRTNMPVATRLDIAGNEVEYTYTDLGVNIPLRTGGEIRFDLNDFKCKTNSEYSVYNPSYESDFSASISQPLLRNAGRRVNEHSIRIAEYNRQVTDAQTNLSDAQRDEISALADYQIALVDLAYATGTLLGSAKVEWAPFVPEE